jgi:hypothetical protein
MASALSEFTMPCAGIGAFFTLSEGEVIGIISLALTIQHWVERHGCCLVRFYGFPGGQCADGHLYTNDVSGEGFSLRKDENFLEKPFHPNALLQMIRDSQAPGR